MAEGTAIGSAAPRYEDLPELMNQGRWQEATMLLIAKVDSLYRADTASLSVLRGTLEKVLTTFQRDEAQGYHSRDRQFAIAILSTALAASREPSKQPPE